MIPKILVGFTRRVLAGLPAAALALLTVVTANYANASEVKPESPWGTTAHMYRGNESKHRDTIISLLKDAGITTVREGFGYSRLHNRQDEWDFSRMDALVDELVANGIEIIGILDAYNNDLRNNGHEQYIPMHAHPQVWRQYVREVVSRYKDRVTDWVVWNEPDGGFWAPRPNAAEYVPMLKIAYEEIKAINPQARVITGGLESWNTIYLKAMYEAGAKGHFDIIGVHRYGPGPDESLSTRRTMWEFRQLMAENAQSDVPVWIMEAGGSTLQAPLLVREPLFMDRAVRYALSAIGKGIADDAPIVAGIPLSPRQIHPDEVEASIGWLPGAEITVIPFDELAQLNPQECPVLVINRGIHIDEPMLEPIRSYVERGGLLVANGNPPLYVRHWMDAEGNWQRKEDAANLYKYFRMDFLAWWMQKGIPAETRNIAVSNEALAAGIPPVENIRVTGFFTPANMQEGDTYRPILSAVNAEGKAIAEAVALYTYADWKGAVLGSQVHLSSGWTEEQQAMYIPRIVLSYLASGAGVERLFVYDLHNDGPSLEEREHNFGLTRWDWSKKPSFEAYREMTEALGERPRFIGQIEGASEADWALLFRRFEDDRLVIAAWSVNPAGEFTIHGPAGEEWGVQGAFTRYFYPAEHDANALVEQYRIVPASGK